MPTVSTAQVNYQKASQASVPSSYTAANSATRNVVRTIVLRRRIRTAKTSHREISSSGVPYAIVARGAAWESCSVMALLGAASPPEGARLRDGGSRPAQVTASGSKWIFGPMYAVPSARNAPDLLARSRPCFLAAPILLAVPATRR